MFRATCDPTAAIALRANAIFYKSTFISSTSITAPRNKFQEPVDQQRLLEVLASLGSYLVS